jgi:hypothetical protein
MSWQKRPGHEHDHIDGRTLQHNIRLYNSVTGGEHLLHLLLKTPCCATCNRPFPQSDLGFLDPRRALADALEMLNPNHAAILLYSQTHNIPILLGDLAGTVPDGHKAINAQGRRFLIPPRGKS